MYLTIFGLAKYAIPPLFLFDLLVFGLFLTFTLWYPGILRVSFLSLLCVSTSAIISSFFTSSRKDLSLSLFPIILDQNPCMFQADICIGTVVGLKVSREMFKDRKIYEKTN